MIWVPLGPASCLPPCLLGFSYTDLLRFWKTPGLFPIRAFTRPTYSLRSTLCSPVLASSLALPSPHPTTHPFQAPHLAVSFLPLRSLLQYHLLREALLDYLTSVGNSLSSTATSVSFLAFTTKLRLHLALLIYYLAPLLVLSSMTVRNLSTLFTSVN